jgi:hypothetical protein
VPPTHKVLTMVSPLDRAELERLDRESLIMRAEQAGVSRASILTRPELVDELLVHSANKDDPRVTRARGFFGRARDLLARVIERGLHLPDAADRLRRVTVPAPLRRSVPAAVPTVTLAEIYATQGHRGRAIETLRRVLEHEPDHAAARGLLTRLSDEVTALPFDASSDSPPSGAPASGNGGEVAGRRSEHAKPPTPEALSEPQGFLDDDALPRRYDVDECVVIPVDPTTLFAYWEVRETTLSRVRHVHPDGSVALRVLVIIPSWDGPLSTTTDLDVADIIGDWFIRDLPPGAFVRVAVGWKRGNIFTPIAHCPALETPPTSPSPMLADVFLAWSPAGMVRIEDAGAARYLATAFGRRQKDAIGIGDSGAASPQNSLRAGAPVDDDGAPQGSSDHAYA